MYQQAKLGIIGGSGLYQIEGIADVKSVKLKTPYGDPSDEITLGTLAGVPCAFLPRHGRGHRILPQEINYRANVYVLKMLGVEQVISVSACGSLKDEIVPRDIVLPDQLFDRTRGRVSTFFGDGIVAHIGIAEPFCTEMRKKIYKHGQQLSIKIHYNGTYVCIEGPQFSTKAESTVNRILGFSVVGMTALPEAKLAREAELCYTTLAIATDYDVWKEGEEVTVDKIVENLNKGIDAAKRILKSVIPELAARKRSCECKDALKYAIFTQGWQQNKTRVKQLGVLVDKYLENSK